MWWRPSVDKSIENGIDIIRMLRRAERYPQHGAAPSRPPKSTAAWCEAAISYTVSPVHNEEYFVKLAKELEQMGADTICIKDMANLLLPYDAYNLVKQLKAERRAYPSTCTPTIPPAPAI